MIDAWLGRVLRARRINQFLGTSYTAEDIIDMRADDLAVLDAAIEVIEKR